MSETILNFADETAMLDWAQQAAGVLNGGLVIHLLGDLGMGKTTLSRGLIQGLGHKGKVKSPTYTLVEPYELDNVKILDGTLYFIDGNVKSPNPDMALVDVSKLDTLTVYHFDLYRLADPEELEFMGVRDYFSDSTVSLIEWPEKGFGVLPEADVSININQWQLGRSLTLSSNSQKGQAQLKCWAAFH